MRKRLENNTSLALLSLLFLFLNGCATKTPTVVSVSPPTEQKGGRIVEYRYVTVTFKNGIRTSEFNLNAVPPVVKFEEGQAFDVERYYREDESLFQEIFIDKGKPVYQKMYYPDGVLRQEHSLKDDHVDGVIKVYWEDGKIKMIGHFDEELRRILPEQVFDSNGDAITLNQGKGIDPNSVPRPPIDKNGEIR